MWELLAPSLVRELDCMQNLLFEVAVLTLEGVHGEAVKGEKVHSACLIDYCWFGYFHQFQKLFPLEFNPIRTGVLRCYSRCRSGCPSCCCHPLINPQPIISLFCCYSIFPTCRNAITAESILYKLPFTHCFNGRNLMWTLRPDAKAVLMDKKARASLARYFDVMEDDKPAKFLIAKKLSANFSKDDSLTRLWKLHEQLTGEFCRLEKMIDTRQKRLEELATPEKSFLDLKIEIANRILANCHFCTRRCGSDRTAGELGYCRCGTEATVSAIFQHTGEEPELVPSGTIFTLGCTLRCLHCQNWGISQWFESGEIYSPRQLALAVEQLRRDGCRNVNLVGGDPTSWLSQWLETFRYVEVNVPVVWNSNSYYSLETAELLAGFVDVYLLDFKYGPRRLCNKTFGRSRVLGGLHPKSPVRQKVWGTHRPRFGSTRSS
jgi:uncharacterized Fe-S radical SAM superfamily protein PflX